jgi:spore coat polysaccharide biosynthesis predicted glycosyltransferase SpsG
LLKSHVNFFIDASVKSGLGHFRRCVSLAEQLDENKTNIQFLVKDSRIKALIGSLSKFDVIEISRYTEKINTQSIYVIDTYNKSDLLLFEKFITSENIITIFDGQNNYIKSKIFISFGSTYSDSVLTETSRYYSGSKLIPLRKLITKINKKLILTKFSNLNVLVYTGYNENNQIIESVLIALRLIPFINNVYTLKYLYKWNGNKYDRHLHQLNFEQVLTQIQFAVTSSGVILWELTWLRIPALFFKASDNQEKNFILLGENNLGLQLNLNKDYSNHEDITRGILKLLTQETITQIYNSQVSFAENLQIDFFQKILEENF